MSSAIREPAVAGQFYPRFPDALTREIHDFTRASGKNMQALGCVVPHAGYMYSGHVAGAVYASVQLPRRFVVLCPNHTGYGQPLAVSAAGKWRTPLGEAAVDAELARALLAACPALQVDDLAHLREHAIEVQLPFLQVLVPEFTFVPIAVGTARYESLRALGEALATVVEQQQDKVLLIASSDMNHYEADDITRVKDGKAIEKILALDARGLYDVVMAESISMCGFGPAVATLTAANRLGATSAQLVRYATSADVSGDRSTVVGYAGVAVQ